MLQKMIHSITVKPNYEETHEYIVRDTLICDIKKKQLTRS